MAAASCDVAWDLVRIHPQAAAVPGVTPLAFSSLGIARREATQRGKRMRAACLFAFLCLSEGFSIPIATTVQRSGVGRAMVHKGVVPRCRTLRVQEEDGEEETDGAIVEWATAITG